LCGKRQPFAVRQENMSAALISSPMSLGQVRVEGELLAVQFLGASQRLEVRVGNQTLTALQPESQAAGALSAEAGQRIALHWSEQHMVMLDA
jgi:hypothetical protein